MLTTKVFQAIGRVFGWRAENALLPELPPPAQTRQALERERARADRAGTVLSVATFSAISAESKRQTLEELVKILRSRLRNTDEIGWLSDREVCAILIATNSEGAWKVVRDVCSQFPADVPLPECTIYTYPAEKLTLPPETSVEKPPEQQAPQPVALEQMFVRPMPVWKRALDIVGAGTALVLLSPLLLLIAVAIKLTSPGAVLFKQLRSGRGGRPFLIWKFRTMVVDAEARKPQLLALNEREGPVFKIRNDPRITALGRLLRSTSLDELPQFWNVLRGDMSLVGPRPLVVAEAAACTGWQQRRLDVTPGLTCIWQVRGRGGVAFADWVRMDLEYIRSRTVGHDLKLLAMTIPAVIWRKGAH